MFESKPVSLKHQIWLLLLANPAVTIEQIQARIRVDSGIKPSMITVSSLRREYRDVLRFLVQQDVVAAAVFENGNAVAQNGNGRRMCKVCKRQFRPKRSHTVFCSPACKQRDFRLKQKGGSHDDDY